MQALISHLLGSIEADRLVILFGAGLSTTGPSRVPTASELASHCHDEYIRVTSGTLPVAAKTGLEVLVDTLRDRGQFALMLKSLVPWEPFRTPANVGHEAIADFINTKAADVVLTTNYDTLVEAASLQQGADVVPALSNLEANELRRYAPYVKLHGCCHRLRESMIWSRRQLSEDAAVALRVRALAAWLAPRLLDRDLLIVGFWSDWAYLNAVLANALEGAQPSQVMIVDTAETEDLKARAPELWAAISAGEPPKHVRAPGAVFLDSLRRHFGRQFVKRVLDDAKAELGLGPADLVGLDDRLDPLAIDAVSLRRYLAGVPSRDPVREKRPSPQTLAAGIAMVRLTEAGGTFLGKQITRSDRTFTIVAAHGRPIARVRKLFEGDFLALSSKDVVVCAGATPDGGTPSDLVRTTGRSVVRASGEAVWLTSEDALALMNSLEETPS